MGRRRRMKPERLAEKLLQIRTSLGLSQPALLRRLGLDDLIDYRRISEFELGDAEPPLPVLLRYCPFRRRPHGRPRRRRTRPPRKTPRQRPLPRPQAQPRLPKAKTVTTATPEN